MGYPGTRVCDIQLYPENNRCCKPLPAEKSFPKVKIRRLFALRSRTCPISHVTRPTPEGRMVVNIRITTTVVNNDNRSSSDNNNNNHNSIIIEGEDEEGFSGDAKPRSERPYHQNPRRCLQALQRQETHERKNCGSSSCRSHVQPLERWLQ